MNYNELIQRIHTLKDYFAVGPQFDAVLAEFERIELNSVSRGDVYEFGANFREDWVKRREIMNKALDRVWMRLIYSKSAPIKPSKLSRARKRKKKRNE